MKLKRILLFLHFLAVLSLLGWFFCVVAFLLVVIIGSTALEHYYDTLVIIFLFGVLFFVLSFILEFLKTILDKILYLFNKRKLKGPDSLDVGQNIKAKPINIMWAVFISMILSCFYLLLCMPFLINAEDVPPHLRANFGEINSRRTVVIFGILALITNSITFRSFKYKKVGLFLGVYWVLGTFIVLLTAKPLQIVTEPPNYRKFCEKDQTLSLVKNCTFLIVTDLGHGSGFAIYPNYIVTNKHVIEGARKIKTYVSSENGTPKELDLKVWGYSKTADLAVLKTPEDGDNLAFCEWANSDDVNLAEELYAIGWPNEPFGDSSITRGVFSRYVNGEDNVKFIQTDAPINPGNSGGPLVNKCGIVGINTFKVFWSDTKKPSEGYGFAIASNYAKNEIDNLIKTGSYKTLPIPSTSAQNSHKQQNEAPSQSEYTKEFVGKVKEFYSNVKEAKKFWFNKKNIKYFDTKKVQTIQAYISKVEEIASIVVPKIVNNQPLSENELNMFEEMLEKYNRFTELEKEAFDNIKF